MIRSSLATSTTPSNKMIRSSVIPATTTKTKKSTQVDSENVDCVLTTNKNKNKNNNSKYNKEQNDGHYFNWSSILINGRRKRLAILLLGFPLGSYIYFLIWRETVSRIILEEPSSITTTATDAAIRNKNINRNFVHPLPPANFESPTCRAPPISWSMQKPDNGLPNNYEERFSHVYHCYVGDVRDRVDLEPSIKSKVWFRTDIQTNLNILVMGDSVAMQIGELLQEVIGIPESQRTLLRYLYPQCSTGPRTKAWRDNECVHHDDRHQSLYWGQSPQGGGAGGWRLLHWWLRKNAGKPLPETPGGGWDLQDSTTLLNATQSFALPTNKKIDVLVFRVSQPWMKWYTMTPDMMHKTIQVAREQLGVNVVIFMTIPFANNVANLPGVQQMHEKNQMIRQFARDYPTSPNRLEDMTVLTLDFAQLNNALVQHNAQQLGFPVQDEYDFHFSLNTLYRPPIKSKTYTKSIGQICGAPAVPHQSMECIHQNMITVDGQHICLQTFGGRMMAGLACVIRCAYSHKGCSSSGTTGDTTTLQECEESCNAQYMSLRELDTSFFDDH